MSSDDAKFTHRLALQAAGPKRPGRFFQTFGLQPPVRGVRPQAGLTVSPSCIAVADGKLITGQNPGSSKRVAEVRRAEWYTGAALTPLLRPSRVCASGMVQCVAAMVLQWALVNVMSAHTTARPCWHACPAPLPDHAAKPGLCCSSSSKPSDLA